jgi:hypothetical protein
MTSPARTLQEQASGPSASPLAEAARYALLRRLAPSMRHHLVTLTGVLLIVVPLAFNVTFFLLQRAFEYPDILRKPTDYVLRRFQAGGAPLLF